MPDETKIQPDPNTAIEDISIEDFKSKVIDESAARPVLVDFWAPWCEPCKQLAPILEKVATSAEGRIKLVKMNIDAHPQIAGQLGIKSIPAVIAFQNGQPADGFMGAVPEGQIRDFVERLIGPISDPIGDQIAAGFAALEDNNPAAAIGEFEAALAANKANYEALAGLARANIAINDLTKATTLLDRLPHPAPEIPSVLEALAALKIARQAGNVSDLQTLKTIIADDPGDHQARLDLAIGLAAAEQREEAAELLIHIIKENRDWNDGAAKKQILEFFQIWGPMDEHTIAARRKLSAVLFS